MYSPDISVMQIAGGGHLHDVIGTMAAANLDYAMSLHEQFPAEYKQALHSAQNAKTMLLYLLLDEEPKLRAEQHTWLEAQVPSSQELFAYFNCCCLKVCNLDWHCHWLNY